MLKVRLMGTKNDIVWFQEILQRHPKSRSIWRYQSFIAIKGQTNITELMRKCRKAM